MAVTEAVTNAVNIDMIFIPVMIQMKQKSLPGNDLGELSPYLVKQKKKKHYQVKKKGCTVPIMIRKRNVLKRS